MLDDLLEKGVIQLPKLKRPEDVRRTSDPKYCCYHRMVSHSLEKCVTLKERIMRLIEDGTIILDLDDIIEINHISYQTKGLSLIQFGSLKHFVPHEHRLMTKTPCFGVATSSKGLLQEESNLLMVHTSDGFDLNAYKLMKESRYDFSKPSSPGYVIDAKRYGPNAAETGSQNYDTKDWS